MEPHRISVEEASRRLDAGEDIVFLDTRSEEARGKSAVQIPGSRRVPPHDVDLYLSEVPCGGTLVTYCT